MREIIDGRVYDTDTAEYLAFWCNKVAVTDFHYYCEELYMKRNGEYFLYGEGNGLSPYASYGYGGSSYGEAIVPLTLAEAKEWAEKADCYEDVFGEVSEDDEDVDVMVRMPREMFEVLRQMASGTEVTDTILKLIKDELSC